MNMTNQDHPHLDPEESQYYPRPKRWPGKLLGLLIWPALFLSLYALIFSLSYSSGVNYALSLWPAPIEIKHADPVQPSATEAKHMVGFASFYDYVLASGWSSKGHFVCAMRDFPRGNYVKVTNLDNDKSIVCKITDYGPDFNIFPERIVDLSSASFAAIADIKLGEIPVKVELLD